MRKKWISGATIFLASIVCAMSVVGSTVMAKENYEVNMSMQKEAKEGAYSQFFLKDRLQTISIDIDQENLQYMFDNAIDKPSVMTNSVTIGDQIVGYAGLKTKGSYTLDHAVWDNQGSNRYSLTINFGKYIKKKDYGVTQNFYGVSKISLNNFFFDKTMMKEYCALTIMTEMGIPTPEYGLTKLYINGDYYGVYFMVEAIDSSILERFYQLDSDEVGDYLCKPENTKFVYDELVEDPSPLWEYDEDTYKKVEDTIPTVMEWSKKLNQLSQGKDFEDKEIDVNSKEYEALLNEIMDVDEALRYFAVHSFLVQTDNMFVGLKNFGLYVSDKGRSTLIPWDYDLSFGCYSPGDAESTANYKLDMLYTTWGQGQPTIIGMEKYYKKYPLFNVLFQNEDLRQQMHTYMEDCAKIAALGGTTSFGKSFDPAMLNGKILQLKDELVEAASEKVASNAHYMNHISQPAGVNAGLPNLAKVIAMRSAGVYAQVHDMDTLVGGRNADNEKLGNGQPTWWPIDNGNITTIDASTGIFMSAEYKNTSPILTVKELEKDGEKYNKIAESVGNVDDVRIYEFSKLPKAQSDYTVTIPVCQKMLEASSNIEVWAYADGKALKIDVTRSDNLFTFTTDNLEYILVTSSSSSHMLFIAVAIAIGAVILAVVIVILAKKGIFRKKEEQN